MTPAEKNRLCAEALGYWKDADPSLDWWHDPQCTGTEIHLCVGLLPDFLHSEDANAMLLEAAKMCVVPVKTVNGDYLWSAAAYELWNQTQQHADRKTAIVNAAVAFIQAGGKLK